MKVELFFDYACPFCYVGLAYVERLLPEFKEIEIVFRACEAHPDPEPRMKLEEVIEFWQQSIIPLANSVGLKMKLPKSPVSKSDLAFQGMHFILEHQGDIWTYHNQIYEAMFVKAQDIEDISVLVDCAAGTKVDLEEFKNALLNGTYREMEEQALRYAYLESFIEVVPTLVTPNSRLSAKAKIGVTEEEVRAFFQQVLTAKSE